MNTWARIRFVSVGLWLLLSGLSASGQVLLEDFDTIRHNGYIPLWGITSNENQRARLETHEGDVRLRNDMLAPDTDDDIDNEWYVHMTANQGQPRYPYPNGYIQSYIKTGTWSPLLNRMQFWVKCSKFIPTDARQSFNVGTYIKPKNYPDKNWQGQHYYHLFSPNFYPHRWVKAEMTWTPTSRVSTPGRLNIPTDPEWNNGSGVHYFDGMTRFYISIDTDTGEPFSCWIDDFELFVENNEPEDKIKNMTVTYNGEAYELSFNSIKQEVVEYEIRYSIESMKKNGFQSGTPAGRISNTGSSYAGVLWTSPPMALEDGLYWAIRPLGKVDFSEMYFEGAPGGRRSAQTSSCDHDGSGLVDDTDVQLAVDAALGMTPCRVDLDQNRGCDVVDVQRTVVAALGGQCRLGP